MKVVTSLNPSPPLLFGFAILSHATHEIFFFPGSESHQNLVSVDWMLAQTDCGSLKQDMEWEDIGARTLFVITILPAVERNLEDQLTAL